MGAVADWAWERLRARIAQEREISIHDAEEIMQECKYALYDYWDGKSCYSSESQILDDYLGIPRTYLWVFKYT